MPVYAWKSNLRRWTQTAIDCHERNTCEGCSLYTYCLKARGNNPLRIAPMRMAIIELTKLFGRPTRVDAEGQGAK